jgi:DNA-binding NarL/FixJ family response regulator
MELASVLLADDHEDFLATAARHLEGHFHVVEAVGDGQALLDQAARLDPDIVVLDISMPVLNGIEAARRLRAAGSPARIIFLTMHADPDFVRAALATGALGYVVKSRLVSDLLLSIREALAGRRFVSPCIAL